jgi:hypothetical protein
VSGRPKMSAAVDGLQINNSCGGRLSLFAVELGRGRER